VRLRSNGLPEGESNWTRRALAKASRVLQSRNSPVPLNKYLAIPSAGDGVDEVFDELYRSVRSAVFHAKNGRIFALPQYQRDRQQVADALARYLFLYIDLAERVLGGRFPAGGLASGGFAVIAEMMAQWTVGVSSKKYRALEEFGPKGAATLLPLATVRAPSHDQFFRAAVLGTRPVAEFPAGLVIRSVGARTEVGEPVTVEALGGALTLEGAHRVEHLLSFQAFNSGPKTQYDG
jgi:hypothetical protein